jgi:hypothetical protein
MTGRNDNYGGDFKGRLENCIHGLFKQLSCLTFDSEIIFVNYNPLPNPAIADFITWPKSTSNVQIRIITVEANLHQLFIDKYGVKNIPVIEYLGKNVGIRRAKGTYILSMNPDILFPDLFFEKIIHSLNKSSFYRANRVDFTVLENGLRNYSILNLKGHSYNIQSSSKVNYLWIKYYNFARNKWLLSTIHLEPVLNFLSIPVYYHRIEFKYHCKNSGDFILTHCENWQKVTAYYEKAPIALHIDALFVVLLAMSGLQEVVVKAPIYHQEHERRFTSDHRNEVEKSAYEFFQNQVQDILNNSYFSKTKNESWGLENEILPEIIC